MTTRRIVLIALLATALLIGGSLAVAATNSGYTIDWFTVAGGGGTSSGGSYTASGTIGQSDAGTLSGGSYTLQGGFWPGVTSQQLFLPVVQR